MNFYISKIRLWFRHGGEPRDLDFLKDKVNVITGDSSTGKSSILKIVDYCLLSERSTIVEDVINENVAWYGLVFHVDDMPYTIIRQSPTVESAEMKVIFREGEFLPHEPIADLDDIRAKAMVKMNELFHINPKLKLESKVKQHFRHNLVFNYLTEDIIATESTYQDLRFFRRDEYSNILNDLFQLAIRVNEGKLRELESELQTAQTRERNQRRAQEKEQENKDKFENTKAEIANQVEELGLGAATDFGDTPMAWSANIKAIVENCNLQFKNEEANRQRNEIEMALVKVRERLGFFESLEKEYRIYQKRLERQNESLVPVEYVKKHLSELMTYQETGQLLRELTEAWERIKQSYEPDMKLPEDFENAKRELLKEERQLVADWKKLNPYQIDQKDIVWIRKAILLAERMEKELTKEPKLTITDEMLVQYGETISSIEEKLVRLRAKNENALGNLNDEIGKYFKYQTGISEAYRNYKPVYSLDEKMLMLITEYGEYPKANVGSKSNFMFLHLCYFFGLHDLLMQNRNEQIPQFLFIDQPSIPYYADKNTVTVSNNGEITNDDREKLKEAFRLTDKFMREMTRNGHFQIIMIEHAGEEYWKDLETFVTRYEFRNGEGLIPSRITHRKND